MPSGSLMTQIWFTFKFLGFKGTLIIVEIILGQLFFEFLDIKDCQNHVKGEALYSTIPLKDYQYLSSHVFGDRILVVRLWNGYAAKFKVMDLTDEKRKFKTAWKMQGLRNCPEILDDMSLAFEKNRRLQVRIFSEIIKN